MESCVMDRLAVDFWGASITAEGIVAIGAAIVIVGLLTLAMRPRS
jgi:hypothetical protein